MRYCAKPSCPVLVEKGRCAQHQQQQRAVETRYQQGNYGRPWRRLRQQFLEDTYPWYCAIHSPHCTAPARAMTRDEIEVDHIVPHRGDVTLRNDVTNLQVACKSCHSWKTSRETMAATGGTSRVVPKG